MPVTLPRRPRGRGHRVCSFASPATIETAGTIDCALAHVTQELDTASAE